MFYGTNSDFGFCQFYSCRRLLFWLQDRTRQFGAEGNRLLSVYDLAVNIAPKRVRSPGSPVLFIPRSDVEIDDAAGDLTGFERLKTLVDLIQRDMARQQFVQFQAACQIEMEMVSYTTSVGRGRRSAKKKS